MLLYVPTMFFYPVAFFDSTDLVPKENVEKWLKYLRNEFPTLPFKASTQEQSGNLVSIYFNLTTVHDMLEY